MEVNVFKTLKLYKIRLISFVIDIAIFILVGFQTLNSWSMQYGLSIRIIFMLTMLIGFGFSMEVLVRNKRLGLMITYITTYISGVLIICLLSNRANTILGNIIFLHSDFEVFSFLCLPFLISSVITIFMLKGSVFLEAK